MLSKTSEHLIKYVTGHLTGNNREIRVKTFPGAQWRHVTTLFQHAYIPEINFSVSLPHRKQARLSHLNV